MVNKSIKRKITIRLNMHLSEKNIFATFVFAVDFLLVGLGLCCRKCPKICPKICLRTIFRMVLGPS